MTARTAKDTSPTTSRRWPPGGFRRLIAAMAVGSTLGALGLVAVSDTLAPQLAFADTEGSGDNAGGTSSDNGTDGSGGSDSGGSAASGADFGGGTAPGVNGDTGSMGFGNVGHAEPGGSVGGPNWGGGAVAPPTDPLTDVTTTDVTTTDVTDVTNNPDLQGYEGRYRGPKSGIAKAAVAVGTAVAVGMKEYGIQKALDQAWNYVFGGDPTQQNPPSPPQNPSALPNYSVSDIYGPPVYPNGGRSTFGPPGGPSQAGNGNR